MLLNIFDIKVTGNKDRAVLNVRFHVLVPDGVFHKTTELSESFMRTKGPGDQDVKDLVQVLAKRIFAYFKRRGLTDGMSDHLSEYQTDFMDQIKSASVVSKISLGSRAGQRVRRLGLHIIRYHGVFAPHSKARPDVVKRNKVPKKPEKKEQVLREELVPERLKKTKIFKILNESRYVCDFTLSQSSGFQKAVALGMQIQSITIYDQAVSGVRSVSVNFQDPHGSIESFGTGVECDLNSPVRSGF